MPGTTARKIDVSSMRLRHRTLGRYLALVLVSLVVITAVFARAVAQGEAVRADGSLEIVKGTLELVALPDTWPASDRVDVANDGQLALSGITGIAASGVIARLEASSQPKRPVLVTSLLPGDVDLSRTAFVVQDSSGTIERVGAQLTGDGRVRLTVPHFSRVGWIEFVDAGALADFVISAAGRWLEDRFKPGVCQPNHTSGSLGVETREGTELLSVWAEDESAQVTVRICNKRSAYVEFWADGLRSMHDLIAPRRTISFSLPKSGITPGASVNVRGQISVQSGTANTMAAVASLVPLFGSFAGDFSLQDVEDLEETTVGRLASCLGRPAGIVSCALGDASSRAALLRQLSHAYQRSWGVASDPERLLGIGADHLLESLLARAADGATRPVMALWSFARALGEEIGLALDNQLVSLTILAAPGAGVRGLIDRRFGLLLTGPNAGSSGFSLARDSETPTWPPRRTFVPPGGYWSSPNGRYVVWASSESVELGRTSTSVFILDAAKAASTPTKVLDLTGEYPVGVGWASDSAGFALGAASYARVCVECAGDYPALYGRLFVSDVTGPMREIRREFGRMPVLNPVSWDRERRVVWASEVGDNYDIYFASVTEDAVVSRIPYFDPPAPAYIAPNSLDADARTGWALALDWHEFNAPRLWVWPFDHPEQKLIVRPKTGVIRAAWLVPRRSDPIVLVEDTRGVHRLEYWPRHGAGKPRILRDVGTETPTLVFRSDGLAAYVVTRLPSLETRIELMDVGTGKNVVLARGGADARAAVTFDEDLAKALVARTPAREPLPVRALPATTALASVLLEPSDLLPGWSAVRAAPQVSGAEAQGKTFQRLPAGNQLSYMQLVLARFPDTEAARAYFRSLIPDMQRTHPVFGAVRREEIGSIGDDAYGAKYTSLRNSTVTYVVYSRQGALVFGVLAQGPASPPFEALVAASSQMERIISFSSK